MCFYVIKRKIALVNVQTLALIYVSPVSWVTHLPVSLAFRKFPLQFDAFLSLYLFILLRLVRTSESRSQEASRNFIFTGWLGKQNTCLIILSGLWEYILTFNYTNLNSIKWRKIPECIFFPKDSEFTNRWRYVHGFNAKAPCFRFGNACGRNVLFLFCPTGILL